MGMTGRWVSYGQEAAEALRDEIRSAKGAEPLAPVTVVVPSNQAGVSARRQLASGALGAVAGGGPGLIGVAFLTPYRLAELLGAVRVAGAGRRPVSTPVIAAAVRAALAAGAGVFAPVAQHPATEAALVSTYRELRDVSATGLEAVARQGRRAADVVRLHTSARSRLVADWSDEEDLMTASGEVLGERGAGHLGTVVIYLPQRLSRHAAELVRAVGAGTEVVVLAGATGEPEADAEVARSMEHLGVELGAAPAHGGLVGVVAAESTKVITASDADEEVRAAVRMVVDSVRHGTPLDRIAVLHASPDPYGRLVHEHLAAAGVTVNGTAEVPVAGRLAGRTLIQLLELAGQGFRREDVFALLASVPVRHQNGWAPITAWERLSREAGVVGGPTGWEPLLTNLADRLEQKAAAAQEDPERPLWQSERWLNEAWRARQLSAFMADLIGRLQRPQGETQGWRTWAVWANDLLRDLLGGADRRADWPEPERKAAERVELALDRLGALGAVEGPVSVDVFSRTLALELESDLGRVGRFGRGVLIGSLAMAVGLDLDLVVLLGLAEGTFPSPVRDDSLLPDAYRTAASGELVLRAERVGRSHHQFLAALAGASRQVLVVPRGDLRRSTQRVASRWVLDVASTLAGTRWWSADLFEAQVPWVQHVASFDAGVRNMESPATAQEHRLRTLLAAAVMRPALQSWASGMDPVFGAGVATLDARHGSCFTRFDGNLHGLTVPSPVDNGTSASSLQRWAECPHAYFMQNVLGVEPVEEPEARLQISALDKGSLIHEILELFVKEVLARPGPEQLQPGEPWAAADRERLLQIAQQQCDDYQCRGLTGRDIFWRRDRARLIADLCLFLVEDDKLRHLAHSRPVAAELAFGLKGRHGADDRGRSAPAVAFPLPDGRSVPLRGLVDRVDQAADGTLHVIDYKTAGATDYKDLSEEKPHSKGTKLQLAIYAEAARFVLQPPHATVNAHYWFITSNARFCRRGYQVTPDVTERVAGALQTIVSGIEGGLFAAHPKAVPSYGRVDCVFCEPDSLGTSELRRHWANKMHNPDLASYVELTESLRPPEGNPAEAVP